MDKKYTNIKERVLEFAKSQSFSIGVFLDSIGMTYGSFKGKAKKGALNSNAIAEIYTKYPNINLEWLITGNGNMLIDNKMNNETLIFEEHRSVQSPEVQSFDLVTDSKLEHQRIPLYSIQATAGVVPLFANSERFEPVDHITIPNLPKSDGALFVSGDSMYPLLKSGDIVIYKTISSSIEDIYFGEMYIVSLELAGEEYTSVKFVQRSELGEAYIKLVSQNKHHEDKDVRVSKIRAMALVKASIRINSM